MFQIKSMSNNDLAIDQYLRSTWLTVQKMYNEQASQFNSTMVMGFTLLSIDPKLFLRSEYNILNTDNYETKI